MAMIPINLKTGEVDKGQETIIVGIDLGTTNSLVAVMNGEKPLVIQGDQKDALVPSMIFFDPSGEVYVGQSARSKVISDPTRTIFSVKRLMGKSYNDISDFKENYSYNVIEEDEDKLVKIEVDGKFYSPIDLSALLLKELKARVEKHVGSEVSKAVITVPAYFNDTQRQATRDAGKLAGLDVLRIINEPTAASLAYGLNVDQSKPQKIAVYDLGGGTFDISILNIEGGIFEVLSTNGDTFLGGDDFDRVIVDHWMSDPYIHNNTYFKTESGKQALRMAAEEAKKVLSRNDKFETVVNEVTVAVDITTFQALSKSLVDRTIDRCKLALKDAKLSITDIDHIIMVGGSTRMPVIKDAVAKFFDKPVNDSLNPDEVVAAGAAIQADILAGRNKEFLLLDITPLSLGIETVGGLMDAIIPRNTTVPTKAGRQYTTSVDGQTKLKVAVYQGERDLVENNRKLGEFVLSGIPPMAAGLPKIEIQFIIDADGILRVKAKELRSNVETQIDIKSQYGISEEEMALMLMDSMKNAATDMEKRVILEAINEANNVLLASKKFMTQHAAILSVEETTTMNQHIDKLAKSIEARDKDLINQEMKNLNEYSEPLAHRAMDSAILESMKGKKI